MRYCHLLSCVCNYSMRKYTKIFQTIKNNSIVWEYFWRKRLITQLFQVEKNKGIARTKIVDVVSKNYITNIK